MTDKLILSEIYQLPETLKLEVLHFTQFLKKEYEQKVVSKSNSERVFGRSKGRYKLSADFDAPMEDFKEYM